MIVLEIILRVLVIVGFGTLGVLGGGPIVNAVFRRVDDGRLPPSLSWRRRKPRPTPAPSVAAAPDDSPTVRIDPAGAPGAGTQEGIQQPDPSLSRPEASDLVAPSEAVAPSEMVAERVGAVERADPGGTADDVEHRPSPGLVAAGARLPGGAWIGFLERLAIFASLVFGFPQGVTLVLALKGLARYPEIRAQAVGTGERFIIGTFVSVLVACASALVTLWLLGHIGRIA